MQYKRTTWRRWAVAVVAFWAFWASAIESARSQVIEGSGRSGTVSLPRADVALEASPRAPVKSGVAFERPSGTPRTVEIGQAEDVLTAVVDGQKLVVQGHKLVVQGPAIEADWERKVAGLVEAWAATQDASKREKIQKDLNETLKQQFQSCLAVQEKEVVQLEAGVRKLGEQLEQRRKNRDQIVETRARQLLRDRQGLGWNASTEWQTSPVLELANRSGPGGLTERQRRMANLTQKTRNAIDQWVKTQKDSENVAIPKEVREVLEQMFQLRIEPYELDIAQLEADVRKLREQVDRRRKMQNEIVDFRVRQLLHEKQGLGWAPALEIPEGRGVSQAWPPR